MKENYILKTIKTIAYISILFMLLISNAFTQDIKPLNGSETYKTAANDTIMFDTYGSKKPQVEPSIPPLEPLKLPERIKPHQDLLAEYSSLEKEASFNNINGTKYFGDIKAGSHSYGMLGGTVIHGRNDRGFAIDLRSLTAKENTPQNLAQTVQELSFRGNLETESGDFGIDLNLAGHNDNIPDSGFRPGNRKAGLFSASGSVKKITMKKWELGGDLTLEGGSYNRFGFDKSGNEFGLNGNISVFGDFDSFYLGIMSSIENYSIAGNHGSVFKAGFHSGWLLYDLISIKPEGDFHIFDVPGKPARGRFYPKLGFDASLPHNAYIRLNLAPSLKTTTFREYFKLNGLINSAVPVAIEDRKNEVNGELGVKFPTGISLSLGGFCARTGDYTVFTRSGDFFSLVTLDDVTLYGAEIKTEYRSGDYMGIRGNLKLNGSDCDYEGKVPYLPSAEGNINIFARINSLWKIRGILNYYGEHYVETGLSEKQKSFATVDIGFDRKTLNDSALLTVEVRNITNSKGAWWDNKHKAPGIGFYSGFKIIK